MHKNDIEKHCIETDNYALKTAFLRVEELEEMSRDDKFANIRSYAVVLLYHLVKKQAQQRTTKSWEDSIHNCVSII